MTITPLDRDFYFAPKIARVGDGGAVVKAMQLGVQGLTVCYDAEMRIDPNQEMPPRFRYGLWRPMALLVFVLLLTSGAFCLLFVSAVENVHNGESASLWGILAFAAISAASAISLWSVLVWEDRRACIRNNMRETS